MGPILSEAHEMVAILTLGIPRSSEAEYLTMLASTMEPFSI